jgi:hypothetical protein
MVKKVGLLAMELISTPNAISKLTHFKVKYNAKQLTTERTLLTPLLHIEKVLKIVQNIPDIFLESSLKIQLRGCTLYD